MWESKNNTVDQFWTSWKAWKLRWNCVGLLQCKDNYLILDNSSDKEGCNNGRDVGRTVTDAHEYPGKVGRQIKVVDVEAHVDATVESDGYHVQGDGSFGVPLGERHP